MHNPCPSPARYRHLVLTITDTHRLFLYVLTYFVSCNYTQLLLLQRDTSRAICLVPKTFS